MVRIYFTTIPKQKVPPLLECMNDCCQLQIMSRIIFFMFSQLPGSVGDYFAFLHQYASEAFPGCVAIYFKALVYVWYN